MRTWPGIGEFGHLWFVAIKRVVFSEIIEGLARNVADEGLGGGAFGEDEVVGLGFDAVDRVGLATFRAGQAADGRAVHERACIDQNVIDQERVACGQGQISVREPISQNACGHAHGQEVHVGAKAGRDRLASNQFIGTVFPSSVCTRSPMARLSIGRSPRTVEICVPAQKQVGNFIGLMVI